jgi:hypothetical protein
VASEQVPLALPVSVIRDDTSFTAFRFSAYDVPFWTRNNTRDARWNRAHEAPTQYWSLCPEASWSELIRYEGLMREEELDEVRMPMWVCRIPKVGMLDLRDVANLEAWNLAAPDVVADTWDATQTAATALRAQGVPGILSASAALPGHTNVTLFGPRRMVDWHARPALASALPATRVSIGRPPPGLVEQVKRAGPQHASQRLFKP